MDPSKGGQSLRSHMNYFNHPSVPVFMINKIQPHLLKIHEN